MVQLLILYTPLVARHVHGPTRVRQLPVPFDHAESIVMQVVNSLRNPVLLSHLQWMNVQILIVQQQAPLP